MVILLFLGPLSTLRGQTIRQNVSGDIDTSKKYVFYLHGQIALENGKGISQHFGVYEYQSILDTFSGYGYKIISEPRKIDAEQSENTDNVFRQIDTLLNKKIDPANIIVVGASAGAYMTIDIAAIQE